MQFRLKLKFHSLPLTLVFVLAIYTVGWTVNGVDGRSSSSGDKTFTLESRRLSKRTFSTIQCKGAYDKNIFMELERVCNDCYNLYQETQLYVLCRSNCFGSSYFKGCLDALLLNEEEDKYDSMIEVLGKK